MWWRDYSAPDPEKPLLEQLLEARDNLRRQIEALQDGATSPLMGGRLNLRDQMAEVSAVLEKIEAAIAAEEAGQAEGS